MITPYLLQETARPGTPGLTFFTYRDVQRSEFLYNDRLMNLHDMRASDRIRSMLATEMRVVQPGSVRRQYLVRASRREFGPGISQGLRALHDGEDPALITHYRVIWFAEAIDI